MCKIIRAASRLIPSLCGSLLYCTVLLVFAFGPAHARDQGYYPIQELLVTSKTIVGEDIRYPTTGTPKITVAIVTVAPGAPAAFHRHPVPLVAYILEGELTVDYGAKGVKTFHAGDSLVEAMDTPHRGMNLGTNVVRLLAIYIGAEGSSNVTLEK